MSIPLLTRTGQCSRSALDRCRNTPPPASAAGRPALIRQGAQGIVSSLPFRAHVYFNGSPPPPPPPPPVPPGACTAHSVGTFNDARHQCHFTQATTDHSGNSWETAAADCFSRGFKVAGAQASLGQEVWCGNTLTPACPAEQHKSVPCPGNHSETCGDSWVLEVIEFSCDMPPVPPPPPPSNTVSLNVSWAAIPPSDHTALIRSATAEAVDVDATALRIEDALSTMTHTEIPVDALGPTLPVAEAQRDLLQRTLATGWGPWLHSNMLPMVKLPDAATISPSLCSATTKQCVNAAVPDGARPRPFNKPGVETRVGLHAFDRSFVSPPILFGTCDLSVDVNGQ